MTIEKWDRIYHQNQPNIWTTTYFRIGMAGRAPFRQNLWQDGLAGHPRDHEPAVPGSLQLRDDGGREAQSQTELDDSRQQKSSRHFFSSSKTDFFIWEELWLPQHELHEMIELTIDRKKRAALKMSTKKIPTHTQPRLFVKVSVDQTKLETKRLTLTYLG